MSRINKFLLETNTLQGRDVFKVKLQKSTCERKLASFLHEHGFDQTKPATLIERLKAHNKCNIRLEKLGFVPDKPLDFPNLGQSHEVEFADLRCKINDQEKVTHAFEFYSSKEKQNGITDLKVVGETLGKTVDDATTEIILGPTSTKDEYEKSLDRVMQFRKRVMGQADRQPISMAEALGVNDHATGKIWFDEEDDDGIPCIHTTRGVPIRAISTVLNEPESRLTKEAKLLLKFACEETDSLVAEQNLNTVRGKKLWETLNHAIWMSSIEGVLSPLMPDDIPVDSSNNTLVSWTKYAGKNFIGIVSRFTAGDLLRSGGLQARDKEKLTALFASENEENNQRNFNRMVFASENVIKRFVATLLESKKDDLMKIAQILREKWTEPEKGSVISWVKRDLSIDFIPGRSLTRYPNDTRNNYGNRVNANTGSSSYAHSQFVPRREIINNQNYGPVAGAFEFRTSEYVANARVESYFTRGKKRQRQDVNASWKNFDEYRERLSKKPRIDK